VPIDAVRPTAVVATPEGPVVAGRFDRRLDVDGVILRSDLLPSQFVVGFGADGHRRWSLVEPTNAFLGLPLLSRSTGGVAVVYTRESRRASRARREDRLSRSTGEDALGA
jgi:hypothetical protein